MHAIQQETHLVKQKLHFLLMPVQRVLTLQVPDIIFNVYSWFVLLAICYIVDTRASSTTTSTQAPHAVHG